MQEFTKDDWEFILAGMKADLEREQNARPDDVMMTEDGLRKLQELISRVEETQRNAMKTKVFTKAEVQFLDLCISEKLQELVPFIANRDIALMHDQLYVLRSNIRL